MDTFHQLKTQMQHHMDDIHLVTLQYLTPFHLLLYMKKNKWLQVEEEAR